jgi:hypothetical protein
MDDDVCLFEFEEDDNNVSDAEAPAQKERKHLSIVAEDTSSEEDDASRDVDSAGKPLCPACGLLADAADTVVAFTRIWHAHCVKCSQCGVRGADGAQFVRTSAALLCCHCHESSLPDSRYKNHTTPPPARMFSPICPNPPSEWTLLPSYALQAPLTQNPLLSTLSLPPTPTNPSRARRVPLVLPAVVSR